MDKTLLIIGLIFPEPEATAAGSRMLELIQYFQHKKHRIIFASTAGKSDKSIDFNKLLIQTKHIQLNDAAFDDWVTNLNPDLVLFDRFITEEQFGWRIRESCPNAIRILDTEDLHFLRKAREAAFKKSETPIRHILQADITKREIASIYRCDLSLIISEFEEKLLLDQFKIAPSLILYLPFLPELPNEEIIDALPSYAKRKHFLTIGNFKHNPNKDAVIYLKQTIWPLIRKNLPKAELHVYGAYGNESMRQLHNIKEGFYVEGWAPDKKAVFTSSRVCLAPLRFGAGLKGKLLDSMLYGTPNITTNIGVEGMNGLLDWNGFIANEPEEFTKKAVELYTNQAIWDKSQENGFSILKTRFNKDQFYKVLSSHLEKITLNLAAHREQNFIGSMLNHHAHQSTKYLSKWIEAKNANLT